MRILIDTNILIDLYTSRRPDNYAQKLLIMHEFGDAELWASAKSFTDIFYILSKHFENDRIYAAFDESFKWLNLCSVDGDDIRAAVNREWKDFEDCIISICAEKAKADFLLTRDKCGFKNSKIKTMDPKAFFNYLESDLGIAYDWE